MKEEDGFRCSRSSPFLAIRSLRASSQKKAQASIDNRKATKTKQTKGLRMYLFKKGSSRDFICFEDRSTGESKSQVESRLATTQTTRAEGEGGKGGKLGQASSQAVVKL